ncbi:MAG: Eco57I restriction-modification methylase domain-containing protein [Verrucomicrobia bacterium]|nr:Eco57I restriction-modification methylase domain-containing protein [Verrucomicrobiota bacterium]
MPKRKQPDFHPELGLPESRRLWQTEGLFADHYLKTRIQKNDWWPTDARTQPIWQFCKELYEKRAFGLRRYDNEMGVRQELIDKILQQLGFDWSDNLRLPDTKQDLEPDYILYASAEEKEAVADKSIKERFQTGIAILEAKKFGHPLSQISKHQQRYPHQQIRAYLDEAQVISWGILTNGSAWRLYCRGTKPSEFFEIELSEAIKSLENFKFFLALFCPAAFVREVQGRCRLDLVREGASEAQSKLEEDLRLRIFGILEILANGFAERMEKGITDTALPRLYEASLIFLYRLLFILYAEGRALLPLDRPNRKYYKHFSLRRLIPALKSFAEYDSRTQTRLYREILDLCRLINGTDEKANREFDVPRYNGGLFDPAHYPELEQWCVCDAVLADVLRELLFNPLPKKDQPSLPIETVDYAGLRVQQLGSIYEGLLEHHFARENGKLMLQTNKAERKATGAYYTPDYIVKYIVEHTVAPLLKEIEEREPVKSARAFGKQDNSFAEEVLKLNICDPAMGSGHFLVEATTYLAYEIVYHPTTKFQAEFTKGESQEQAEIAHWRRRVVEACIYGVDLNPLAVELAKLSLWLTTIASDQPLNFLDHHLRCGNSLIGARLDQLGSLPEKKSRGKQGIAPAQIQFTFGPDFKRVVAESIRQIHEIEAQASGEVAAVKAKEKRWEVEILPRLAPYKKVADLWINAFFDGPLSEEEYLAAAKTVLAAAQAGANRLQEAAERYHIKELDKPYFHWELEFPEVFFTEDGSHKENPGFDAVIGNPPFVNAIELNKALSEFEKPYWAVEFSSAAGAYDLYILFLEQAIKLTRKGRLCSLITPNKFLSAPYAVAFRDHLCTSAKLVHLLNVSRVRVFEDPSIYPVVSVIENSAPANDYKILVEVPKDTLNPKETTVFVQDSSNLSVLPEKIWGFLLSEHLPLVLKTQKISESLEKRTTVRASSTAAEADAYANALANTPLSQTKKFLNTGLIDRYASLWGVFPLTHKGRLMPSPHLDLSDPSVTEERKKQYAKPKIVFAKMAARIEAFLDESGEYASANTNFVYDSEHNLHYLLALLNSNLMAALYGAYFGALRMSGGYYQFQAPQLRVLPIRLIAFTTPPSERKLNGAQGRELCERGLAKNDAAETLGFVEKQLKSNRADVVHDLLVFLAARMMALNKDKQTAAKQFLTDLKDFHSMDVRSLTPKTKLDEFWKLESADLFAHLRKNARALAAQGIHLKETDEEKIRARFQNAKEKLVLLDIQIVFTDRLIDQIVYALYGLTPGEVKLVEESVQR